MLNEVHLFLKTILKNTIFERKTYFVGGCVRDFYREKQANDIDIVIELKDGSKNYQILFLSL